MVVVHIYGVLLQTVKIDDNKEWNQSVIPCYHFIATET
jgi:hypothetical protein